MLSAVIDLSLRHRFAVLALVTAFVGVGLYSLTQLDIDAFPDVTPVQVQVNTVAPQLGPDEVEQRITQPLENVFAAMPKLENVRSISKFGLSQVVLTFEDGTDMFLARQLINERLSEVKLSPEVERPRLGPISGGLGEVFHYVVLAHGDDRTVARTFHEWVVRPQMRSVRGVAEVNTWGGYSRQYQIRLSPEALVKYDLTYDQVLSAVDANNRNVGGGVVRRGSTILVVHGLGRVESIEALGKIVVTSSEGRPVFLRDVAEVRAGDDESVRRGAVTYDGQGQAVLGLGFLTTGENSRDVTIRMKAKLDEIRRNLPRDIELRPVYDRTGLIDVVIDTARRNLLEGGLFVVAVLFAFLGGIRAACIVAMAIPLSMMGAFLGMHRLAIAASLLSLGALDFGMVVDSSVVMVENCMRRLAHSDGTLSRRELIRDAAVEVRQPTLFGELIILVVYLPILTLEGIEGKMFRPMALTVIFALATSMVLSMTLMPVLASLFLPRRVREHEPLVVRIVKAFYRPMLRAAVRYKYAVAVSALLLLAIVLGGIAPQLGGEFVPKLSEGSISMNVIRPVGTALEVSVEQNLQIERRVKAMFPREVKTVWSRIGCADVATDPMGIELTDMFVTLHPRKQWRSDITTQDQLTDRIKEALRGMLGAQIQFSQPIEMRFEESFSGSRTDVAIKIQGDDLKVLKRIADQVHAIVEAVPGADEPTVDPVDGQSVLQIRPRAVELEHHGIPVKTVLDVVEAIGGRFVGEAIEGQRRFPIVVTLPPRFQKDPSALGSIIVTGGSGERVFLRQLADIEIADGPPVINREASRRKVTVGCNIRGRDLAGFVNEVRARVDAEVSLPPGGRYTIEFAGEYAQMLRARKRLWIVCGLALLLIVSLLYITYGNIIDTLRVLIGIPFACVGGVIALYVRDMPFSISAGIGFVALSGTAVLDDMILVSTIRRLRSAGMAAGEAVEKAAEIRLRPVLMTTLVAGLGFVPMAFSVGEGAEVQRPLATVVIGGVISAMVMSLLVLRVLYVMIGPVRRFESLEKTT